MDLDRTLADAEELYRDVPAYDGIEHARRTLDLAKRLAAENSCDLEVLQAAAALQTTGLAATENHTTSARASAAVARAYLTGQGEETGFIDCVCDAIAILDWTGTGEPDVPPTPEGILLWHSNRLDLLSTARHVSFLLEPPHSVGARSELFSARHLELHRDVLLIPALELEHQLWLAGSAEVYTTLMQTLSAFLDDLAAGRFDALPLELRLQLTEEGQTILDAEWRRLGEIRLITTGISRILQGTDPEDPKAVKSKMPAPGLPYQHFRALQRQIIIESHRSILDLAHRRIAAAQAVAVEKYFNGDTIYKPLVEQGLFRTARKEAHQIGLDPDTAEDIARLLLAKARALQERTVNRIASRLSREHGEVLDAEAYDHPQEADVAIPPMTVFAGDALLAREDELVKELRITGLNHKYPAEQQSFGDLFDDPHPYAAHGLVVGSRGADTFLQAMTLKRRPCTVLAKFRLQTAMHLGHGAIVRTLAYYQSLGARVAIGFDLPADSGAARSAWPAASMDNMVERVEEYLLTFAAFGLDLESLEAYSLSLRPELLSVASTIAKQLELHHINSALDLQLTHSASSVIAPIVDVANILHHQLAPHGDPFDTMMVTGLEDDFSIRLARRMAPRLGLRRPAGLYLSKVKSLLTYGDPSTQQHGDPTTQQWIQIMDGRKENATVFYSDEPDDLARKVRAAHTGGRTTPEEQRRLGGNPDPRICSISNLHGFHGSESSTAYSVLVSDCRSGNLLCSQCKEIVRNGLEAHVLGVRELKAQSPSATVRRARQLSQQVTHVTAT